MVEAKHEFIDDNPYLIYSPDAEATASGSGGGGFPVIVENTENYKLPITAKQLVELLKKTPVAVYAEISENSGQYIYSMTFLPTQQGGYNFLFFGANGTTLAPIVFEASSDDDYPVESS